MCFLTLVACVTSAAHDATLDLLDSQNSDPLQLHWKKQDGEKKSSLTELSGTQEAPCCSSSQLTPPHRPIAGRRGKKKLVSAPRRS